MKIYSKPEMEIMHFHEECVVTESGKDPVTKWQQDNTTGQLLNRKLDDMQNVMAIVF